MDKEIKEIKESISDAFGCMEAEFSCSAQDSEQMYDSEKKALSLIDDLVEQLKQKEQQCERLQTAWQSLKGDYIKLGQENEALKKQVDGLELEKEQYKENAELPTRLLVKMQELCKEQTDKLLSEKQMLVEALEKIAKTSQCENIIYNCPCNEWGDECVKYLATQTLQKLKGELC